MTELENATKLINRCLPVFAHEACAKMAEEFLRNKTQKGISIEESLSSLIDKLNQQEIEETLKHLSKKRKK